MERIEIDGREVVGVEEIVQLIYDRGVLFRENFPKYYINVIDFYLKNKIDFVQGRDRRNPYKKVIPLFFVDSVLTVEKIIIGRIEIFNSGDSAFKISKEDCLDSKTIRNKFYSCEEIGVMLINSTPFLFGEDDNRLRRAKGFMQRNRKRFNYIQIDDNRYFPKEQINILVKNLSKAKTLEEAKAGLNRLTVDGREVVTVGEMTELIVNSSLFAKEHFPTTREVIVDFFMKNNIEFLDYKDDRNPYGKFAFFIDTVPIAEQRILDSILIYNTEDETFNIMRDSLNPESIMNDFYTAKEAGDILGDSSAELIMDNNPETFDGHTFMMRNSEKLNYIEIGSSKLAKPRYFIKKEVNQVAKKLSQLMSSRSAMEIVNKKLNLDIKYRTFLDEVERQGFISDIRVPFKSDWFLINKNDIDKIVSYFDSKNKFQNAETAYGRLKEYISSNKKIKNDKIPETLKYFDSYCLEKSNKTKSPDRYVNMSRNYIHVYKIITSRLTKEIYELNSKEIEELIIYSERYSKVAAKEIRLIYNYIVKKKKMDEKVLPISRNKFKEVLAYPLDTYFKILAELMNNLNDNAFIQSLIGNRSLSSLTLYIYTHYISVWRRRDIIQDLPQPNLKLIGFNTGDEFLNWLKAGNFFTEKMGKLICEDIQEKIYIYRESADKNDGDLLLYVSEYMYSTYGLLLAICEANRQVETNATAKTNTLIAKGCVYTKKQEALLPLIFDDVKDVLDSSFSNKRANKSFETYVAKKSEEWNLGIGYILAAIFRGHKINANLIAEVTKVYITKDVNESSLRAFNMGVMSGVKYRLLEAIGVNTSGDKKVIDKAVSGIELTPLQTELTMKNLSHKSVEINEFLDKILTGKDVELTLKELLYGKNSYGKHVYTKCLYRAFINAQRGQVEYIGSDTKQCINANSEGCIGCPFLVAERFFLYEVEKRLTSVVDALNNAKNEIDKKIYFHIILNLYMPLIKEAYSELGMDQVESIINVDTMMLAINKHKYLVE